MPEIKFLGPERLVEVYRRIINNNLENWDQNNDTFTEILHLIGITKFPQKNIARSDGNNMLLMSGDCCICFSSQLNDKLPEVICANKLCENCYHVECLYEFLRFRNKKQNREKSLMSQRPLLLTGDGGAREYALFIYSLLCGDEWTRF
ncbi:hypothetical protein JTB14_021110 [Gonioctena quinquepunctata]|nr:hypothetical protein JTB14_021110 [Gonioctena quinquepunctata]